MVEGKQAALGQLVRDTPHTSLYRIWPTAVANHSVLCGALKRAEDATQRAGMSRDGVDIQKAQAVPKGKDTQQLGTILTRGVRESKGILGNAMKH